MRNSGSCQALTIFFIFFPRWRGWSTPSLSHTRHYRETQDALHERCGGTIPERAVDTRWPCSYLGDGVYDCLDGANCLIFCIGALTKCLYQWLECLMLTSAMVEGAEMLLDEYLRHYPTDETASAMISTDSHYFVLKAMCVQAAAELALSDLLLSASKDSKSRSAATGCGLPPRGNRPDIFSIVIVSSSFAGIPRLSRSGNGRSMNLMSV